LRSVEEQNAMNNVIVVIGTAIGNDRHVLLSVITQLLPFIGYPRTLNAIRIINEGTSP
jgi:alkylhydroperoxidase/carboxymuconolactone decarboxylase family protein YurZ